MHPAFPAAALLAIAFPATAETRQFGNLVYQVPPGWSVGAADQGVQYLNSDLPDDRCDDCTIFLGPAVPGRADPLRVLAAEKRRFIDPEDAGDLDELIPPRAITLSDGKAAAITGLHGGGWVHVVMAVQLSDRVQLFGFRGEADDPGTAKDSLDVFAAQAAPLFDAVSYLSEGAEGLLPDARPGPLSGLWWAWTQDQVFQIDGTIRIDVTMHTLLFWPDGHFYDGTPPEGTRPLDRAALLAAGDTDFGTYSLRGKSLTLTYATGETATLERTDAGWDDGRRDFSPTEVLPDGTPLSGTISSLYSVGFGGGPGATGGMTSQSSTTFHPDGSYEGSSYSGSFGSFSDGFGTFTGGFATGASGDEGGRYEVRDGLVIRYPSDGSAPTRSLAYRTGDTIMIGQYDLKP